MEALKVKVKRGFLLLFFLVKEDVYDDSNRHRAYRFPGKNRNS